MTSRPRRRLLLDPAPLRHRGFRAVFVARTVSVFGLGFVLVAVPLQVFALTGSTAGVAGVTAAVGLSALVGTLGGGVLADRYDRRTVILLARAGAGLGYAGLAAGALVPEPALWAIYLCGVVDGLCGGISSTALMSATPQLVPKEQLAAAGALMALMVNIGAVAAPALGGVLVAAGGFAANYAVCTATAVVTVTSLLRLPPLPPEGGGEPAVRLLADGARFAVRDARVGPVLALGLVGMATAGWTVLLPEYAADVLGAGPELVGVLYAAPAVGALLGSLVSGWTGTVHGVGRALLGAALLAALGMAAAGAVGAALPAAVALAAFGLGRSSGDILRYAAVLEAAPDRLRGRVSAVWTAQVLGAAATGAATAAAVAAVVPTRWALAVYGVMGIVLTALVATLPGLRRLRR
ncbi:enterobactin transporter EntS [Pseudonocardia humida]|uniref:Enterobactin transporter EntS n=1 Tax=Pseudonocardia humida TaxID=2800819 RepID=A0ABT0ZXE4_9PSEU|nr:enterobactin transporter EntS [Pseudonocardia humida]MCO1655422.1 enterobactin transporter EntS [Pseudonocardia humida]